MVNIDNIINLHLKNLREQITDYIYVTIHKYGEDRLDEGEKYIPSLELCDESVYLKGAAEPEWNDDLEEEIVILEELGALHDFGEGVVVVTDKGCYDTEELGISDLLLLYKLIKSRYETEE